jgi:ribosomal protein S11
VDGSLQASGARRYYFDERVAHLRVIDTSGVVFDTARKAVEHAFVIAASMARRTRLPVETLAVEVRMSGTDILVVLPLQDVVKYAS